MVRPSAFVAQAISSRRSQMPLDPQIKQILDQAASAAAPPISSLTPHQARAVFRAMFEAFGGSPAPVARVENRAIPGPAGEIGLRIYAPEGKGPFPALMFFHGGGWVIGDLDTHDPLCRELTNAARCITVAVDYRLAPEHKFAAAAEDCYAASQWVARSSAEFGANADNLAVCGDSAGGNLSAAVSLMARDRGNLHVSYQVLLYPALDGLLQTPSMNEFAEGYLLTRADMVWFWNHYLRGEQDRSNPYACPSAATDLKGLPSAMIITAEFDPLRDEGEAYARRLQEAGVPVVLKRYQGMTHGFMSMAAIVDKGRKAIADTASHLRSAFKR
jgi:acetyl esterase